MKNILDNIQSGYSLYNKNYQFIGKTGEFKMMNADRTLRWLQLTNDSKNQWIYGNITRSYKRGFILENLVIKEN